MTSNHSYPDLADQLYQKGLEPIPIAPGRKYPKLTGWPAVSLPITPWPSNQHGIGLRTGKSVIGIDLDIYSQALINDITQRFFDDSYLIRVGQPPKALIPVICPEIESKMLSEKFIDDQGVINQIEILSSGQQFVAYGIHPDTGKPYDWSGDLLGHSLPVVKKAFIEDVISYFQEKVTEAGWLSLSVADQAKKASQRRPQQAQGDAPGAVYNRSVTVETLLEHYGWKHCRGNYWTRPGKDDGVSGAVYGNLFWCFTDSTTLKGGSRKVDKAYYDAFELLTQYEFGGDKSECARALRKAMQEVI